MIKKFNDFNETKGYSDSQQLPRGGYVCKIIGAKPIETKFGQSIKVAFDIAEGEFAGYYQQKYDANKNEDKKWPGVFLLNVPTDDGSERDGWTKNTFAKWTNAFEDSNNGYKWDWKEEKWKGLKVGIVFGETGTVIEGREILYTEPRFAVSIDKVRDGSAPKAKFVAKNGYTGTKQNTSNNAGSEDFMKIPEGKDEEIPF